MRSNSSPIILILSILLLITAALPSYAQTPQAIIRIDNQMNATSGPLLEVPINLELLVPSIDFYRLDLVIKYNSDALTPYRLNLAGWDNSYIPECQWNTVSMHVIPDPDCMGEPCSTSLLTIFAAKYSEDITCTLDSSLQLGSILFQTHGDTNQFYPISFYWDHCVNNSFALNFTGATLLVSNDVFDYNDVEITENLPLPSLTGAPDDCVPGTGDTLLTRAIDFHSGGVQFYAIDTTMPTRNNIYIEKTHSTYFDENEQVSIYLQSSNEIDYQEFGSFEFFIQYDTNVATFLSASAGQLMIDCGWEYMSWGHGSGLDCGGSPCPDGIIYLKGIAETDNGDLHPTCLADTIGELVVMNFHITDNIEEYQCWYSPIHFVWYDCSNNTIAYDENADTLFISNDIYDYDNYGSIRQNRSFPTRYGAPYECLGESIPGKTSVRGIDYYNGGFDLICTDSIDGRGDINLNGLANEIADLVLFSNYFFYGIGVFTINVEVQIAATDVNADGIVLSLNDFIYMQRIIIGDALPYPKAPMLEGDTCFIIQNLDANTITIEYTDSLTAVYLTFGDSIEPVIDIPNHTYGYEYVDPLTIVLITPELPNWLPEALLPIGELFSYTGEGHLLSAEVSFEGITEIPVVILREETSSCCYDRGNADGINGPGGPINVADLTYLVSYLFMGGPVPICMEEGNADGITNGGLQIDVADLTYLVDYLFKGGPNPPSC